MKKILALILGLVMVFGLVACGNNNVDESLETGDSAAEHEEVGAGIPAEYIGLKLNSSLSEVSVPKEVIDAFNDAVETEGITFTPVAYIASKGGEAPAYHFLCISDGEAPAIEYENYDVSLKNVKLFNVILDTKDGKTYVKDYYGFDFDGYMCMPEGEKAECLAAFKLSGWEYFDAQPNNAIPAPVMEMVPKLDIEIGNIIYFIGEVHNEDGSVVFALLCSDVVENETVINTVFITTNEAGDPCVRSITPIF